MFTKRRPGASRLDQDGCRDAQNVTDLDRLFLDRPELRRSRGPASRCLGLLEKGGLNDWKRDNDTQRASRHHRSDLLDHLMMAKPGHGESLVAEEIPEHHHVVRVRHAVSQPLHRCICRPDVAASEPVARHGFVRRSTGPERAEIGRLMTAVELPFLQAPRLQSTHE